jgi:hypothetical protein
MPIINNCASNRINLNTLIMEFAGLSLKIICVCKNFEAFSPSSPRSVVEKEIRSLKLEFQHQLGTKDRERILGMMLEKLIYETFAIWLVSSA